MGVVLKAGRAPATGLRAGDVVQVIRAVDGAAEVLSSNATVSKVNQPEAGTFGTGGDAVATVVVDVGDAPKIAAAVVADQVAIVLLPRPPRWWRRAGCAGRGCGGRSPVRSTG